MTMPFMGPCVVLQSRTLKHSSMTEPVHHCAGSNVCGINALHHLRASVGTQHSLQITTAGESQRLQHVSTRGHDLRVQHVVGTTFCNLLNTQKRSATYNIHIGLPVQAVLVTYQPSHMLRYWKRLMSALFSLVSWMQTTSACNRTQQWRLVVLITLLQRTACVAVNGTAAQLALGCVQLRHRGLSLYCIC